jgi:hypothetical protein
MEHVHGIRGKKLAVQGSAKRVNKGLGVDNDDDNHSTLLSLTINININIDIDIDIDIYNIVSLLPL